MSSNIFDGTKIRENSSDDDTDVNTRYLKSSSTVRTVLYDSIDTRTGYTFVLFVHA